ncbi:MAG: tyrosine-type recombinase/integrase [Spirulinaceae cyanobacterium]
MSYTEGKTPVLETEETRELLDSIDTSHVVGLRDRAVIGVMLFTFARIGAVIQLQVKDYAPQGKKFFLKLAEKGSKERKIPVHHTLEEYLDAYIEAGGLSESPHTPLFRSTRGRSRTLTERALSRDSAWRMIRRRVADAGLAGEICNHSFRATGITNFLTNGGSRDRAQYIAGHADVRTTALYDRRREMVSLDDIERIRF